MKFSVALLSLFILCFFNTVGSLEIPPGSLADDAEIPQPYETFYSIFFKKYGSVCNVLNIHSGSDPLLTAFFALKYEVSFQLAQNIGEGDTKERFSKLCEKDTTPKIKLLATSLVKKVCNQKANQSQIVHDLLQMTCFSCYSFPDDRAGSDLKMDKA